MWRWTTCRTKIKVKCIWNPRALVQIRATTQNRWIRNFRTINGSRTRSVWVKTKRIKTPKRFRAELFKGAAPVQTGRDGNWLLIKDGMWIDCVIECVEVVENWSCW